MTVICAYAGNNYTAICGDSMSILGEEVLPEEGGKIFSPKLGILAGMAGSSLSIDIVRDNIQTMPDLKDGTNLMQDLRQWWNLTVPEMIRPYGRVEVGDDYRDIACQMLIATRGGLFHLTNRGDVIWAGRGSYAIGSGKDFALGAMYQRAAGDSKNQAIAVVEAGAVAASALSLGVGGRLEVMTMDDKLRVWEKP